MPQLDFYTYYISAVTLFIGFILLYCLYILVFFRLWVLTFYRHLFARKYFFALNFLHHVEKVRVTNKIKKYWAELIKAIS